MIIVNKKEVKITEAPQPLTGEVNVETLDFEFSPEWAEVIKVAEFVVAGKPIYQVIRDNQCSIPALNYSGTVGLGVFGYVEENGETVLRYSPKPTTLKVGKGSYIAGGDSAEVSQTDFERYVAQIEGMISDLRGVESVDIVDGHLIVTYTDGTEHDAGEVEGGGGTSDYSQLTNKPKINGIELSGNETSAQLGLQSELVSGTNIKTVNGESVLGSGNIKVVGLMPTQVYQYSSAVEVIADTSIPQGWYILGQSITLNNRTFGAGDLLGIYRDSHGGVISYVGGNIYVDNGTVEITYYLQDFDLEDYYNKDETDNLLAAKQNTLTFDSTPTAQSTNPVTSAGIKTYVDTAIGDIDTALQDLHTAFQGLISGGGAQ